MLLVQLCADISLEMFIRAQAQILGYMESHVPLALIVLDKTVSLLNAAVILVLQF